MVIISFMMLAAFASIFTITYRNVLKDIHIGGYGLGLASKIDCRTAQRENFRKKYAERVDDFLCPASLRSTASPCCIRFTIFFSTGRNRP
jgi:hypothetical protein